MGKNALVLHSAKWISLGGRQANFRRRAPLPYVRFDQGGERQGTELAHGFRFRKKDRVVSSSNERSVARAAMGSF